MTNGEPTNAEPARTRWGRAVLTLRQWGSVVGGAVAIVAALVTLGYLASYGAAGGAAWAGLTAVACAAWLVLAWPHVTLHLEGVRLHNPLRTVSVPWNRYEGAAAGWTLQVWSERGTHDAFGVAAKVDRRAVVGPGSGDPVLGRVRMLGLRGGADELGGPPAARPRPAVTPAKIGGLLEDAKAEWEDAVRRGELPTSTAPTSVVWNPVNVALLVIGAVAVVVWVWSLAT